MSKTPEELAEEYMDQDKIACAAINHDAEDLVEAAFLAGYKAAQAEIEAYKDGAKDVVKKFKELIAAKDQVADTSKVMPQWISVKDRLPKADDFCLVNTEFDCIRIAQYGWESWRFNDAYSSSEHPKSYVTHWMPLPKPPESK
jgi:hypothetical protein